MIGVTVTLRPEEGVDRFAIAGEIDLSNAEDVEESVLSRITNQMTDVIVDLTEVTYLDSAGIRVLFAIARRLKQLQVDLVVESRAGSTSRRILELSGLDTLVPLVPSAPDD